MPPPSSTLSNNRSNLRNDSDSEKIPPLNINTSESRADFLRVSVQTFNCWYTEMERKSCDRVSTKTVTCGCHQRRRRQQRQRTRYLDKSTPAGSDRRCGYGMPTIMPMNTLSIKLDTSSLLHAPWIRSADDIFDTEVDEHCDEGRLREDSRPSSSEVPAAGPASEMALTTVSFVHILQLHTHSSLVHQWPQCPTI